MSFNELLSAGAIEYLDCEEEDTMLVAFFNSDLKKKDYTHCEISNAMMNGLCAATIPFSDRNPGTRNTYQCAMGKQAIGIYASNFNKRMDKTAYILNSPMKPLVETRVMNMLKMSSMSSGNQS